MSASEYLDQLRQWHLLMAVLVAAAGCAYLLMGWKLFKVLVVVNAMVLGAVIGRKLGLQTSMQNMEYIGAAAGALLLGALAWPLMKWAVSVMGAIVGAGVGFSLWQNIALTSNRADFAKLSWVGALIGLITLGLLAFIIFRAVVIFFTSVQGAVMLVSGSLALVTREPNWRASVQESLTANSLLLPLLTLVLALLGAIFQESYFGKKAPPKSGGGAK